jgi:type IV secretory pathway VirB2 component (pilin)
VLRLVIAIVLGLMIAIGGAVLVTHVLSGQGGNTPAPSTSSVDNYGNR